MEKENIFLSRKRRRRKRKIPGVGQYPMGPIKSLIAFKQWKGRDKGFLVMPSVQCYVILIQNFVKQTNTTCPP